MVVNFVAIKLLLILLSFLSMIIYEVLGMMFTVSQSYFLNQARAWFLKIVSMQTSVCVFVCVRP